MRTAATIVIIVLLFAYVPLIPIDDCPEAHHTKTTLDCGYLFHCPALPNIGTPGPSPLTVVGRCDPFPCLFNIDEPAFLIFHPPKIGQVKLSPWGGISA
jgi:hypothetical protein